MYCCVGLNATACHGGASIVVATAVVVVVALEVVVVVLVLVVVELVAQGSPEASKKPDSLVGLKGMNTEPTGTNVT